MAEKNKVTVALAVALLEVKAQQKIITDKEGKIAQVEADLKKTLEEK